MSLLTKRLEQLADQHGGVRPAARFLEIDPGYFLRLANGEKDNPSDKLLRKLGLTRVVTFIDTPRIGR
jgi:hypothetical protein